MTIVLSSCIKYGICFVHLEAKKLPSILSSMITNIPPDYMTMKHWQSASSLVKVRSHMRGRRRAENWLQHKSLHAFTHARSRSGGGAGAKTAPQEMGPTPNLPRLLRNRALQTIIVLKKWQIRPRPLRVCVNIPAVAEREFQNPPASAPQPPRACVNVAWFLPHSWSVCQSCGVEWLGHWPVVLLGGQWWMRLLVIVFTW